MFLSVKIVLKWSSLLFHWQCVWNDAVCETNICCSIITKFTHHWTLSFVLPAEHLWRSVNPQLWHDQRENGQRLRSAVLWHSWSHLCGHNGPAFHGGKQHHGDLHRTEEASHWYAWGCVCFVLHVWLSVLYVRDSTGTFVTVVIISCCPRGNPAVVDMH